MEFLKAFAPLANWMMRLSLVILLCLLAWSEFKGMDMGSITFWLAMAGALLALFLLLGGATGNQGWTRITGLLIAIIMVYYLYASWWPGDMKFIWLLLAFSVSMNFAANGNKV